MIVKASLGTAIIIKYTMWKTFCEKCRSRQQLKTKDCIKECLVIMLLS
jgi:hypothetical protein